MDKKFPMAAKSSDAPIKVEIVGLDEIFNTAIDTETILCKYERFAEHVILSCAMPEIPRYTIHDEEMDGSLMQQGLETLDRILVRYRRMTAWLRQNNIDPENVCGKPDEDKELKRLT